MHEIDTHMIEIQIMENTTILYSNNLKITQNQMTINLYTLPSSLRLSL